MQSRPGKLSRLAEVRAAAAFQWRLLWRRRRRHSSVVLGLGLLPAVAGALVALLKVQGIVPALGTDVLKVLLGGLELQILLVLVPIILGTGLIGQEVEARTLPFLLVRPLSRASLLLGKLLAAWATASLLLIGSLVLAAVFLLGADHFADAGPWLHDLPRYLLLFILGTLAYVALFTCVGMLFRHSVLVSLALGFGWETWIPWLPGWIKSLTIRHHLAALLPEHSLPSGLWAALDPPALPRALLWLGLGTAAWLAVSILAFKRRDYA